MFNAPLICTLTFVAGASQSFGVTYSDSTFSTTDWTLTTFNNTGGVLGLSQAFQDTFFGNPPPSRKIDLGAPGINGINTMMSFNTYLASTYNPGTSGAILSLDYEEDGISKFGNQVYGAALKQGSNYYVTAGALNTMSWATYNLNNLTASSFGKVDTSISTLIDMSVNPDFSASGGSIQFGFFRLASSNGSTNMTIGDVDNWSVEIQSVPEPASMTAVGLGVLAMLKRRRSKSVN